MAQYFTKIKLRQRYKAASESTIGKLTKKVMTKWVKEKAKECPDPLPRTYFCERPVKRRGVGTSLQVGGLWAGEFRSPWVVATPPRKLRPGYNWWLTCWSEGRRVQNAGGTSNLWYMLTNGLWVNDLFLYTGTDYAIEGVSHC